MLKNYLLITLRNLNREKRYALINVVGLALALACFIILTMYVRDELTYDQHHVDHERIVRIVNELESQGQTRRPAITSPALGPLFAREYPQASDFVRFQNVQRGVFRSDSTEYYWDDVYLADDNVFSVFNHEVIYGDLSDALVDPSSIALSESFARQYFGDTNPIGETISTDTFQYRVTAVFKDLPDNSHLKYSALLSYNRLAALGLGDENMTPNQLFGFSIYTYVRLPNKEDIAAMPIWLQEFYDKQVAAIGAQFSSSIKYYVQPLADIHFDTTWENDRPTGNIFYVYGFSAVALFVLLIACINYTNLAIARATKRAKEVGMRKVIGAKKSQIIGQFIGESLLYTLIATVLAIAMVEAAESYTSINTLVGKNNILDLSSEPILILWLLGFSLLIGLAAGAYPAFYLSNVSPLAALTAVRKARGKKYQLREILVFVQFFVSIGVVACTLLMGIQMQYIASKSLGFDTENQISIELRGLDVIEKYNTIRNELLSNPKVLGVASSSYVPARNQNVGSFQMENDSGQMETSALNFITGDDQMSQVMGLELVAGRDFTQRLLTDVGSSVMVNESVVKKMGWTEALGKRVNGGPWQGGRVIGVVKDFNYQSLHKEVEPTVIGVNPSNNFDNVPPMQRNIVSQPLIIKIAGDDIYQTINHIETVMTQFDPKHPFEFRFFNEMFNDMYLSESNLMKLTGIFAGICIFISCLGLFGLSAFTTQQRTKEIGVRKVLGASTSQIIVMLAQHQLLLVGIAAVLASAVSYLVISDWLTAFAYRTTIQPWVFLVAAGGVAAVAFGTMALQSSKTAQSNPVKALRYE